MIPIKDALHIILNHIKVGPAVVVDTERALGLVLADDVHAADDIPPFTNSAMDGYAVKSEDTRGASRGSPVRLALLEDVPAGRVPTRPVTRGGATKIMTGAPLPEGADAVLMVELTEENDGIVSCLAAVRPGENVRRAGEDVGKGERVLGSGTVVRPQEMGMLAAAGATRIRVIAPPRVALLSTGSELVPAWKPPGPGQIRDCNSFSLIGLVRKYGALPEDFGIARDDGDLLREKLLAATACDVIITSGGVSVGEHDLVKKVLADLGAEMKFWQVCMKPGKPLAFGIINGRPVFGLPGNPVSVIVSFEIFVRPAILKMMGRKRLEKPTVTAVCEERIEKKTDRVHFLRALVRRRGGRYYAKPSGEQGSAILTSMVKANALVVIPADTAVVEPGESVAAMMLDWPE